MDEQQPQTHVPIELPDESIAELLDQETKLILLHEAVCWIAFGAYQFPARGPCPIYELLPEEEFAKEEAARESGRFDLAHDQLLTLVIRGRLALYGRTEETSANASALMYQRLRRITPQELGGGDFSEDDGLYHVAGRWYDSLFLKAAEFKPVASLLNPALDPCSVSPGESAPSTPPLPAIDTPQVTSRRGPGRPAIWDWTEIFAEVVRIANMPDGLPSSQAELQRIIAQYCTDRWGREPAPSTLNEKLAVVYRKLDQKLR